METTCSSRYRNLVAGVAACFGLLPMSLCWSVQASDERAPVNFAREILPLLSEKCFVCHGPDADGVEEGMLRLDLPDAVTADRGGYRVIHADAPDQSRLLQRINSIDAPMPPVESGKQLTPRERELLSRWVHEGGRYTTHWSFERPRKQQPEGMTTTDGAAVIDAWIRKPLAANGIDFAPSADPATLVRRTSLLLTGLPPEPSRVAEFLRDRQPDAYDRLLDELMASPRFGEHQARYWLDAVRYGDTHGLHLDNRRAIFPYRDWVVRAINENLPIDRFITWQVAGDLLPDATLEQQVATGFVRMNPTTAEGGAIPEEFQAKNNFDRTETLGTVLLGMSLTCARCHTHKYDPIQQTEYYRLLAFFNNTSEHSMDGNKYEYGPVVKAPADQTAWKRWRQLESDRAALVTAAASRVGSEVTLNAEARQTWDTSAPVARLALMADAAGPFAGTTLQTQAKDLSDLIRAAEDQFATTLVAQELPTPRVTRLLRRGEYDLPAGDPLEPGVPAVMGDLPSGAPRNRLGLAQWLTSRDHPLVARVLVNRLWQQVFGYGLVRTPEDFGVQGSQPTHPELLDWLAVELQDCGWDRQHMLRIMLRSQTFRQSSARREELDDPENRLFARATSYRLDAEVLRDVGLWASGLLQDQMGGEGVKPYQPAGMWEAMAHPASNTKAYERDTGRRLYHRSLYVYWKRTSPHPMMTLFDAPDRESSCVRRSRTNTSLQSLGLLNETQRIEMSRILAERLMTEASSDDGRTDLLFRLLTSRRPSSSEREVCGNLLAAMKQKFLESPAAADALLGTGEIPRNRNLNPVDVAAWSQVCTTILASDSAIVLY